MSRHAKPDAGNTTVGHGSGVSKHANSDVARNAATLLRTSDTPESVARFLRAAAEGNGNTGGGNTGSAAAA